jgi:hypothetical protein
MAAYNKLAVYCEINGLGRLPEIGARCGAGTQYCALIDEHNSVPDVVTLRQASLMTFRP